MKKEVEIKIMDTCHKDALGNEIIIGQKYGCSHNHNGFSTVTIGVATSLSKNGVMLKVFSCKRALYNDDAKTHEIKESINTRGINLFPVQ